MSLAKRLEELCRECRATEEKAADILDAREEFWTGQGQLWLFTELGRDGGNIGISVK